MHEHRRSIPKPNFASDWTQEGASQGDLYGDVEARYAREKHDHPLTFRPDWENVAFKTTRKSI